ncbi:hypothetical protein GCM10007276_27650 [Agaricicola taiwanensis]|uniref:Polysaccharide pyruvyl transferase family protein n=1 Tax=Agaricicola taiwanensis TaxID=591372 RepID=A0A8J3DW76_9RHOB|nr:hypothetical protein [Agaricicola taiwanensis]GGE49007.1 hypothetical protein GCM10007276_27650 [Agaricicola taiwanensis]
MRIFFFQAKDGNFGDDLNDWIWQELWPELPRGQDDGQLLIGIGTILGIPLPPGDWQKHVIGSGMGYGEVPVRDGSWHVHAVRGPVTARIWDLPKEAVAGDSAILLRRLPAFQNAPEQRRGVVFMPHLSVVNYARWDEVCRRAGVTYLDPRDDSRRTLAAINQAELVLADAMHAAIVADSLRVPWRPLITTAAISTLKWMDWSLAVGADYRPSKLRFSCVSECLTHWATRLAGRSHQIEIPADLPHDEAVALLAAEYRDYRSRRGRMGRALDQVRELFWRAVQRPLRALRDSALTRAWDERMIDRAAEQLRRLASEPGHLSDAGRLEAATEKLEAALAELKSYRQY